MAERDPLAALLLATAAGDRAAFADLYRQSAHRLFPIALRHLRHRALAEEVLQECYLTIWHRAADYDPAKAATLTWLSRIVRNRCIDWLRALPPETPLDDDETEALFATLADDAPDPPSALSRQREAEVLERCLEQLEPITRQGVQLAFYHGLSHSELAVRLAMPLGTLKSRLRRALIFLRGCVGV